MTGRQSQVTRRSILKAGIAATTVVAAPSLVRAQSETIVTMLARRLVREAGSMQRAIEPVA